MTDVNTNASMEADLDGLLESMDQDPPEQAAAPLESRSHESESEPPAVVSPTLENLEPHRRPQDKTVCETCPNAVWYSSPNEVKAYCRVMYLNVWSTNDPSQLTSCDGVFVGQQ